MFLLRPRTEPPMFLLLQHRSLHPNLSVVLLQRVSRRMLPGAGRLVANGALYPSWPSGRSPSLPSGREVMPRRRAGVVEEPGRLLKTGRVCVASKPSTERLLKGPLRRRQIAPAQWKRPPWSSAPGDKSDEKLNPPLLILLSPVCLVSIYRDLAQSTSHRTSIEIRCDDRMETKRRTCRGESSEK